MEPRPSQIPHLRNSTVPSVSSVQAPSVILSDRQVDNILAEFDGGKRCEVDQSRKLKGEMKDPEVLVIEHREMPW